jgi:hypothetical protein
MGRTKLEVIALDRDEGKHVCSVDMQFTNSISALEE